MARVSLTPPRTLLNRFVAWYSTRRFGRVLEPLLAAGHHRGVLISQARLERSTEKWRTVDSGLKNLARMRAATIIGCDWCIDFGYWVSLGEGIDEDKIAAVPRWRESAAFTSLERLVLGYAEDMTHTPPQADDEVVARLRKRLGEAGLVELTSTIAVENLHGRSNLALGLPAQGFKESCELPART